jgi:hypothetical protein
VEDVVEAGARPELEAVGGVVDDGCDAVRPVEAWPELSLGGHVQGGWGAVVKSQPNPIAHCISSFTMILVVVALVDYLRLLQAAMSIGQELILLSHALGHRSHPCFAGLVRADGGWVAAVDDLEWRVLEGGLKGGVVDVFFPWQPA